jgi:molybdopterin-guanine dinucleotide biosynthesis protein A
MADDARPPVGGYVLAGGKSSRMGMDKALLELDGVPLVAHAVRKLRRICADVHILSGNPALAEYAPVRADLHPGCGPIGGIETALAHSGFGWNVVMPVDLPFVPSEFVESWVQRVIRGSGIRVAYFDVAGRPQPTLLVIRRDAQPQISAAIERGEYKLVPALELVAGIGSAPYVEWLDEDRAQLWFVNLNTPADLEVARRRSEELPE